MAAKVTWSPLAQQSFDNLISFLEKNWEHKVIQNLFSEINSALNLISEYPEMFPLISSAKKLRKCVIKRKTILIYRVKSLNSIELVIFADSRQNPKKYKF